MSKLTARCYHTQTAQQTTRWMVPQTALRSALDGVINGTDHSTPEGVVDEQAAGTLLQYTDGAADGSVDGAADGSALGFPDGVIDGTDHRTPEGVADEQADGTLLQYTQTAQQTARWMVPQMS